MAGGWVRLWEGIVASPAIIGGALTGFFAFAWWARVSQIDLEIAWKGFSPIAYVYKALDPASFLKDFPSGVENYDKSAFMYLYKYAYHYFGISPETMVPIVIAAEFLLIAWAVFTLARALAPGAPRIVPALVVVLAVASWIRDMNLAQFNQPFIGQFYNITDALRIFAVIMTLKGRADVAGTFLAISFMTHPMMGLMGAVFCLAMLLVKPQEVVERRVWVGGFVFLAGAAGWALTVMDGGVVSGGGISANEWIGLTKLMSSHWYPVASGLFTVRHEREVLPFLSLLILLVYYFGRSSTAERLSDTDRRIAAGLLAMFFLVGLGILFSAMSRTPVLIKLSLHRANDLIIIVGLSYVTAGLWKEINVGSGWRRALAIPVLISPFIAKPGYPLAFSLLLTSPAWLSVLRGGRGRRELLVTCLAGATVALMIAYVAFGYLGPWTSNAYTGGESLLRAASAYGPGMLVLILALLVLFFRSADRPVLEIVAVVAFIACAVFWVSYQRMGPEEIARDRDYKAAQVWAREYTASSSLFMTDPDISYGWRDYSRRSSFGTVREWLYTSWGYNSKGELYREGLKRFGEFGIPLADYLRADGGYANFEPLMREVQRRYYRYDAPQLHDLAARYGIDYFVFAKDQMARRAELPVVYENPHFVILFAGEKGYPVSVPAPA